MVSLWPYRIYLYSEPGKNLLRSGIGSTSTLDYSETDVACVWSIHSYAKFVQRTAFLSITGSIRTPLLAEL